MTMQSVRQRRAAHRGARGARARGRVAGGGYLWLEAVQGFLIPIVAGRKPAGPVKARTSPPQHAHPAVANVKFCV